jgi:type III secretory pathway component EscS
MPLGTQRRPILWMVLPDVIALAAVGLAISLLIALGTSKIRNSTIPFH